MLICNTGKYRRHRVRRHRSRRHHVFYTKQQKILNVLERIVFEKDCIISKKNAIIDEKDAIILEKNSIIDNLVLAAAAAAARTLQS